MIMHLPVGQATQRLGLHLDYSSYSVEDGVIFGQIRVQYREFHAELVHHVGAQIFLVCAFLAAGPP